MAFKKTVSLQQHTPLIHFHDQPGATLRATELKPKLDRYLWRQWEREAGGLRPAYGQYKQYLVGYSGQRDDKDRKLKQRFFEQEQPATTMDSLNKQYRALDYQLRITPLGTVEQEPIPRERRAEYLPFFGNIGDKYEENPKYFSMTLSPLRLDFRTFHESLLDMVVRIIPSFLMSTNFGTRQSKGFGSFYLHPKDDLHQPPEQIIQPKYSFRAGPNHLKRTQFNGHFKTLFSSINEDDKSIRSDIEYKEVLKKIKTPRFPSAIYFKPIFDFDEKEFRVFRRTIPDADRRFRADIEQRDSSDPVFSVDDLLALLFEEDE